MTGAESYGLYRHHADQVESLRQELVACGLWELLEEPSVTDVMVNESGAVFAEAQGEGSRDTGRRIDPDRLEAVVATIAGLHGRVVNDEQPILEAALPFRGIRVEAIVRPVVEAPVLTLRKPPARVFTLADLVANSTLPAEAAAILEEAVVERRNGLIAGGVGSGKTTLLTSLLDAALRHRPVERLVLVEDGARELLVEGDNVVRLLTSEAAGLDLRRLLRAALRLNPDRLIVGEARGGEAFDWLKACNTGHPGGWLTVHANSAQEAVHRLDDVVQEAGVGPQLDRIVQVVDLVVFVRKAPTGREVAEVLAPEPRAATGELRFRSLFGR
jgi:type IV secretion system protein VirB11